MILMITVTILLVVIMIILMLKFILIVADKQWNVKQQQDIKFILQVEGLIDDI